MPNDVPINRVSYTITDYSKEKSSANFWLKQELSYGSYETQRNLITNNLDILSNGTINGFTESLQTRLGNSYPSDVTSQRERKLLIRYEDDTTFKRFIMTIPSVDLSQLTMITNTDFADITAGTLGDLVGILNLNGMSPDGNDITVLEAEVVGRNL